MSSLSKNLNSSGSEDTRCFLGGCNKRNHRQLFQESWYQHAAITDSDDPFKDLQESLDVRKAADPDMVPEDISTESIVDIDNDVIATAPVITDDDILEQFQKDHSPESDKEDGCDDESLNDEVPERPSRSEVESALDVLKNASLFSNTGEEMQCVIFKFETCLQSINSLKQSDIRVFLESTSSLYLLLCNAFNSYKELIVHHITTYLFFSFSFPEIYELLSISNSLYLEQIPWSLTSSR